MLPNHLCFIIDISPVVMSSSDFDLFQHIQSLLKHPSKVWGASCDGGDVIVELVDLPQMRLGDSLVFPDMGAYTIACATDFNGLPQPVCRYYTQGDLIEWVKYLADIKSHQAIRKTSLQDIGIRPSGQARFDFAIVLGLSSVGFPGNGHRRIVRKRPHDAFFCSTFLKSVTSQGKT